VASEVLDDRVHELRVLLWSRRRGETSEICGEHLGPVHADLPRSGLVGEEDNVVLTFVDPPEKREDELESLARVARIAVGDERTSPSKRSHSAIHSCVPSDFSMKFSEFTPNDS
jgi:hypothetical protein